MLKCSIPPKHVEPILLLVYLVNGIKTTKLKLHSHMFVQLVKCFLKWYVLVAPTTTEKMHSL